MMMIQVVLLVMPSLHLLGGIRMMICCIPTDLGQLLAIQGLKIINWFNLVKIIKLSRHLFLVKLQKLFKQLLFPQFQKTILLQKFSSWANQVVRYF
jgi:hypothetical protein